MPQDGRVVVIPNPSEDDPEGTNHCTITAPSLHHHCAGLEHLGSFDIAEMIKDKSGTFTAPLNNQC